MVGISARLVRRSRATFRSATQQLSVVVPRRWTLRRGPGCACRRSHRLRTSGPIGRIAAAARRVLMVGSAVECERAARDLRQHEGRVEARAFVGAEERANPGLRALRERGEVLSGGGFLRRRGQSFQASIGEPGDGQQISESIALTRTKRLNHSPPATLAKWLVPLKTRRVHVPLSAFGSWLRSSFKT